MGLGPIGELQYRVINRVPAKRGKSDFHYLFKRRELIEAIQQIPLN